MRDESESDTPDDSGPESPSDSGAEQTADSGHDSPGDTGSASGDDDGTGGASGGDVETGTAAGDDEPGAASDQAVDSAVEAVEAIEDEAAESDDEEPDEEVAGLQEGDFIRIDYTARTVEDGRFVDTTDPEIAEAEGIADEGTFEPQVVVIGAGHLFGTVEQDLVGREVGDSGSVVVPPEEAFGEYDPDAVRTVSADKIPEEKRQPGAEVRIDDEEGYLQRIIGGRARVDFNHPLAGDEIEYEYEILEAVTDPLERARGLLSFFLDIHLEMDVEDDVIEQETVVYPDEDDLEEDEEPQPETVTETVEKTTLYIEATPELTMNQEWMFYKQQIGEEIIRRTGIDRIIVQEIIEGGGMGGLSAETGGGAEAGVEDALEEADLEGAEVDAEELVEELEAGSGDDE